MKKKKKKEMIYKKSQQQKYIYFYSPKKRVKVSEIFKILENFIKFFLCVAFFENQE